MIKILLKKQMTEIFRNYFYDAKKNKKRSKASVAMFIIMYVILLVGVLGGMFTVLSVALCGPLVEAGMGWLYFTLTGMLAIFFGAFGSVFNTYSALYLSKDNDLLLSLPIPVRAIMVSRLLGVYLIGLMYSAVVIVPAAIVYLVSTPFAPAKLLGSILTVAEVSIVVLILSCVLGYAVAKISLKLKNKSFITVLVSLLFFAAYYFFYFKAQSLISALVENAATYGEKIRGAAYPLYLFGRMGEGEPFAMLVVTAVVLALFALVWYVLSRGFVGIATSTSSGSGKKNRTARSVRKSVFGTLLFKELKRFSSSPNYMLNCGFGTLFLPIMGIFLLIKGGTFADAAADLFGFGADGAAVLASGAVCMVASMNDMSEPSVSLEGKNLWILKSLPVTPRLILRAKLSVQLILTGIPTLFCAICAAIVVPASAAVRVLLILVPMLYTLLSALFGLFLGLKMPNLTWTNEIAPIKQSAGVMLVLLCGWTYSAASALLYLPAFGVMSAAVYLSIVAIVTAAICAVLLSWLGKKGERIFALL